MRAVGAVAIVVLMILSGCFVDEERQQAAQYIVDQASVASRRIAEGAAAAGEMASAAVESVRAANAGDESSVTKYQEALVRQADILALDMREAHEAVGEAAEMAVVFQEDFGTPSTCEMVKTHDAAEDLRVRYRSGISTRNAIMPVLGKLSPVPIPGVGGAPGGGVGLGSGLTVGGTGLGIIATVLTILQRRKTLQTQTSARQNIDKAEQEVGRLKVVVDHAENVLADFRERIAEGKPIDKDMFKRVLETTGPAMAAEHKRRQAAQIISEQMKV